MWTARTSAPVAPSCTLSAQKLSRMSGGEPLGPPSLGGMAKEHFQGGSAGHNTPPVLHRGCGGLTLGGGAVFSSVPDLGAGRLPFDLVNVRLCALTALGVRANRPRPLLSENSVENMPDASRAWCIEKMPV